MPNESAFEVIWYKLTESGEVLEGLWAPEMFLTKDGEDIENLYAWSFDKDAATNGKSWNETQSKFSIY